MSLMIFFFSSRRRHTRYWRDWSSDVCSSDLIADEKELIRAFAAGEDIHRATAAVVFNVAPDLVTAEQRRAAKTINFGILYGMSAFGLGQALGISPREAEPFIKAYLDRYPGVRNYVEETQRSAEREGKVETLYGR